MGGSSGFMKTNKYANTYKLEEVILKVILKKGWYLKIMLAVHIRYAYTKKKYIISL